MVQSKAAAMKARIKREASLKGRSGSGRPTKTTARSPMGSTPRPMMAIIGGKTTSMAAKKKNPPLKTPVTVRALSAGVVRTPGGGKKSGKAKASALMGAKPGTKAPKVSFIGAKKQASARGNLARKGLAVRDVAARNVQKRIGGTTKRQKSQSRGTSVSKGATNSAADRKLNQQARIKNEIGRGNMAMVKKDGTMRKSAGQVRKIQAAQRKIENQAKAKLAHHTRGIERATKRGDAAGVAKHAAARREVTQAYKGFAKGGRQVTLNT